LNFKIRILKHLKFKNYKIKNCFMQLRILALNKSAVISLTTFAIFLVIAIFAPLLHNQIISGGLVNAALFLATVILGWPSALAIATLPSLIAASSGTLPAPLIPMIPFIITGNAILIAVFYLLKNKNYWLGVISASALKFLFLYSTSSVLFQFLLPQKLAPQMALMMSWPQLMTALTGGALAWLVISLKNR